MMTKITNRIIEAVISAIILPGLLSCSKTEAGMKFHTNVNSGIALDGGSPSRAQASTIWT